MLCIPGEYVPTHGLRCQPAPILLAIVGTRESWNRGCDTRSDVGVNTLGLVLHLPFLALNLNFITHYSHLHLPIVCFYPSQQLASFGWSRLQHAPVLVPLGLGLYCVTVYAFFDSLVAVRNPD